ncbi:MAG: tyrosine recombinase XerC [Proteobacteria bacterium]|nr:tyrosine recombinase XerC [Pseudomonadota bacterium]
MTRFRRYLTAERRLSPHTDAAYARDLAALVTWCDRRNIGGWEQLDAQHLRTFAAQSHAQNLAPRSIRRRLSAVRSFYSFLQREQGALREQAALRGTGRGRAAADGEPAPLPPGVRLNPATDVRAPKAQRRLPDTLDADQMARLLEVKGTRGLAARDHAMMELFYSCGLRLSELVGLDVGSVDLKDRTVTVVGKGSKGRIVPVGRKAVAALTHWIGERCALANADQRALFVARGGRRLTPRAVQLRVARWARRQGIDRHVHPHLFRHSFASHLLESSGELRGVQELLGHANISTTQIYTHLDFQHLARTYDATHPRARRRSGKGSGRA